MRTFLEILWVAILGSALYIYLFHADLFQNYFEGVVHNSIHLAYLILFLVGAVRGFTLIPVTYLIIIGILFFPPLPLFFIIIAGVLVSSASVYYFFEYLNLEHLFEKKYHRQVAYIREALVKNELPIIIGWSALPFLPTDLICYIAGTLEIDIKKLLLGLFIGESITSGLYIFYGQQLLGYLHLVL
jgi:uncharacterized membrane protein YdjX (TVP38/TMEM64 family)